MSVEEGKGDKNKRVREGRKVTEFLDDAQWGQNIYEVTFTNYIFILNTFFFQTYSSGYNRIKNVKKNWMKAYVVM